MKTMTVSRIGEESASPSSKTGDASAVGESLVPKVEASKSDPLGVLKGDPLGVTKAKADPLGVAKGDPLGVTKAKSDPLGVMDQPARALVLPDAPFSPAPSLMEKAMGVGAQVKSEGMGCVFQVNAPSPDNLIEAEMDDMIEEGFVPWSGKKAAILQKYTTDETVGIMAAFMHDVPQRVAMPADTTQRRLHELERSEDDEERLLQVRGCGCCSWSLIWLRHRCHKPSTCPTSRRWKMHCAKLGMKSRIAFWR